MNGKTHSYLDLVAEPAVGAVLLDSRPAVVFAADGGSVLWANAAGAGLFGETRIDALLDRPISLLNPIRAQAARLARVLSADTDRLEILRIGLGVRLVAVPAACRRLNLSGGEQAVLAVVMTNLPAEPILSRAERLAGAIAGGNCLAAVLDAESKVLGASDGFDTLTPVSGVIDELVAAAARDPRQPVKRLIATGGRERPAGAAGFEIAGRALVLVIVGPEKEQRPAAAILPTPPTEASQEVAGTALPERLEEIAAPRSGQAKPVVLRPMIRFTWAIDGDSRFTAVSSDLGAAVGADNAAVVGRRWQVVAGWLGLDSDGSVGDKLRGRQSWSATVYWPIVDQSESIAIELTAIPMLLAGGEASGFHGFGLCRMDDRRPDTRAVPATLAQLDAEETAAAARAADEPDAAEAPTSTANGGRQDLDDQARQSVEKGTRPTTRRERLRLVTPTEAAGSDEADAGSNVVRLPGAAQPTTEDEHLSGSEKDAFQRIAEVLGGKSSDERPQTADSAFVERRKAERRKDIVTAPPIGVDSRLLDRLPIGLVVFRDRRTLFANRTLLDLLGYGSFDAFVAAGGAEAIFPGDSDAWAEPDLADSDLVAERRGGGFVPVTARLNAVTWDGATALMMAIRSQYPSEDADIGVPTDYRERIGVLESILDTATDGVVVVNGSGRIASMNRSAEALFGVEHIDFVGRYFTDLLAEESHKAALDYLDGLASNGVASVLNDGREVIGKVPQGGLIPLFMTMGRLGQSDKFCAVLRDMTHWKNVESELIAARRAAETASAQKSEFLAKVSHEIRTPLNAIIGFSEVMMEERFGPIGNERYRAYLRDIHVSGTHLASLINDLLDLSKIEAGKLDLSFEAVSVNSIVRECVALMQPQANRQRIIIRTSLSDAVPGVVADQRSIRQILLNLLSNAIKFTRPGGQVIASTTLEDSGEVELRIRDTGIGMSEKDIETAMKPFRQVATSDRGEGTGLGLPLTKALVEANRAGFAIDSVVDQGTLIRITFPTTRVLAG